MYNVNPLLIILLYKYIEMKKKEIDWGQELMQVLLIEYDYC